MREKLIAVCMFVVGLTVFNHLRDTPILFYPPYPGLMVHMLISGGQGGTLTQEKIGFALELLTNLTVCAFAAFIGFSLRHLRR